VQHAQRHVVNQRVRASQLIERLYSVRLGHSLEEPSSTLCVRLYGPKVHGRATYRLTCLPCLLGTLLRLTFLTLLRLAFLRLAFLRLAFLGLALLTLLHHLRWY